MVTDPEATRVVTVARIGPAQGAQIKPRADPNINPEINPVVVCPALSIRFPNRASGAVIRANVVSSDGNNNVKPKNIISPKEIYRRISGETLVACTSAVSDKVKKVKLIMSPMMMPYGRYLPCPMPAESKSGNRGSMQGESTVTIPDKKANAINSIMRSEAPNCWKNIIFDYARIA
jgi:hypothetical protein